MRTEGVPEIWDRRVKRVIEKRVIKTNRKNNTLHCINTVIISVKRENDAYLFIFGKENDVYNYIIIKNYVYNYTISVT